VSTGLSRASGELRTKINKKNKITQTSDDRLRLAGLSKSTPETKGLIVNRFKSPYLNSDFASFKIRISLEQSDSL